MTAPVLVTAPCDWQANNPEPCGEPSEFHVYSGDVENANYDNRRFWHPLCKRHMQLRSGAAYCVRTGTVNALLIEPMT